MAFLVNEEIVKTAVQTVNDQFPAYQFDWKTYALGIQSQGRSYTNYIFLENNTHYGLVALGSLNVSTIADVQFLEKSEIQGIRIRKGILNTILRIRMHNGEFWKIIFHPKGGKRLPLHTENVTAYRERICREYAHQGDLKDRNSSIGEKIWGVVAFLIGFLIAIFVAVVTESKFLAMIAFVGSVFGISWLAGRYEMSSAKRKDKAFFNEVEELTEKYAQENPCLYYEKLKKLENLPKTDIYQAQYYQMLTTLAYELDQLEEAQQHLNQFPRRYSEGAEDIYQGLVNLLATPKEIPIASEESEDLLEKVQSQKDKLSVERQPES